MCKHLDRPQSTFTLCQRTPEGRYGWVDMHACVECGGLLARAFDLARERITGTVKGRKWNRVAQARIRHELAGEAS